MLSAGEQRRYAAALCVMVAVAGFYGVTGKLKAQEWTLVVMVIAAAIVSNVAQHGRRFAALLIIVATAFNLLTYTSFGLPDAVNALATRPLSVRRLLPDGDGLFPTTAIC